MGLLFLTALAGLLGYGLGQGVPRLVQRSGALARRPQANQLLLGLALLTPWLVGGPGTAGGHQPAQPGVACAPGWLWPWHGSGE